MIRAQNKTPIFNKNILLYLLMLAWQHFLGSFVATDLFPLTCALVQLDADVA